MPTLRKTTNSKHKSFTFQSITSFAFGIYLLFTLLIVIFVAPNIAYACKKNFVIDNPQLTLISITFGICLTATLILLKSSSLKKHLSTPLAFRIIILSGCTILLILQICIAKDSWFETGWDVSAIAYPENLNFDNKESWNYQYYSTYPNQLFLAGLFKRLVQLSELLGFKNGYFFLIIANCFCVSSSLALMSFVSKEIGGYRTAYLFFAISFFFIGLSPWILIPYSDTFGMLFVCLIFWSYICCSFKYLKWPLFVLFTILGYSIKPTVVFIAVSILLFEIIKSISNKKKSSPKAKALLIAIAKKMLPIMVSAMLAMSIVSLTKPHTDSLDSEKNFSFTHYLMMGLNEETNGCFSGDDVQFSMSIPNKNTRLRANLQTALTRIRSAELTGIADLFIKKTCSNYSDGTFSWKSEGSFFKVIHGNNEELKKIYGIDSDYEYFAQPFQVIWIFILLGCIIACFSYRKQPPQLGVICLALLLISLFLLCFECRARYLLLYAPCFVLLASLGWLHLSTTIELVLKNTTKKTMPMRERS